MLGLVLPCIAGNTNLNNHDNTLQMHLAHLCAAQSQYSRVRGLKTGGRKPCGGPTCFAPLFRSLYRTDLPVPPAATMRSPARNLESLPSGCLNTSFTFVPTIDNNTPHKKEMQEKFLCQPENILCPPMGQYSVAPAANWRDSSAHEWASEWQLTPEPRLRYNPSAIQSF